MSARERELCQRASHPDWAYLGALALLDTGAIWLGSSDEIKYAGISPRPHLGDVELQLVRMSGPAMIGLTWGATIGGTWLALPKCSPHWVDQPPPEGDPRASWPLALSLALLAGSTAPIINGIAIGSYNLPLEWTTLEREMHVVVASLAGFGGALLPYLLPPSTLRAALDIERIRLGIDGRGGVFAGYVARF